MREVISLDREWRFHKGNINANIHPNKDHAAVYNGTKSGMLLGPATKGAYDDSEWEIVNVPHDYIRESAFSEDAIGNHGYREMFDGWYRKTFTIDRAFQGMQALLVFEGIALSSEIYLNGSVVARSDSAYEEIIIDVTDRLYYDRINTLAVFVKGDVIQGWWYEGAGIYKHA